MREANKFLLGARIDYQIGADWAWESAEVLSEVVLGDPDDLWTAMAGMGIDGLKAAFNGGHVEEGCPRCAAGHRLRAVPKAPYAVMRHKMFHRWPDKAAENVWRMMQAVRSRYGGDARRIWDGQPVSAILRRLEDMAFGVEKSYMVVGALLDTGQIKGRGSLKADTNIARVLGRVFTGKGVEPDRVHAIAEPMEPGNTWIFDRRLFGLGQKVCTPKNPDCAACCLNRECVYNENRKR